MILANYIAATSGRGKMAPLITPIPTQRHAGYNGASILTPSGRFFLYRWDDNKIASCRLDGNFHPVQDSERDHDELEGHVDPRLTIWDGRIHLLSSYGVRRYRARLGVPNAHCMALSRLDHERDGFTRFARLGDFYLVPETKRQLQQKNWTPFQHGGRLYFVYGIQPHRILAFEPADGSVTIRYETSFPSGIWCSQYGQELRGSAQPVEIGRGYLSTFHSYVRGAGYYTGFYTFAADPPFQILALSPRPAIYPDHATGKNLRTGRHGSVFCVQMEIEDGIVRLFAGNNTHACVRVEFNLGEVLNSLVQV